MIEVDVSGRAVPRFSRSAIADFARASLAALRRARAGGFPVGSVSIHFVGDEEMRGLNRRWRGRNRTTDVLTFEGHADEAEPGRGRPLGDVVISVEQARRQAREQEHSLATEVRYLILHGLIHALGYDHESDQGEMNELETRVRPRVGLE